MAQAGKTHGHKVQLRGYVQHHHEVDAGVDLGGNLRTLRNT
jgi:hypothetical protein